MILIVFLFIKGVEYAVALVNLHHLDKYGGVIPRGFEDWVDKNTLTGMRDYSLENGRLELLSSGLDILLVVLFIFGGILDWYNSFLVQQGWSFYATGTAFFLFLVYASIIIQAPFDLYSTFSIEEKYGFNKQTLRLWLLDTLKSLVLTTVILVPVLLVVFWLIRITPLWWWLVVWLFLLFFKLFMLFISPYVLEPLFNKFTPVEDEELVSGIKELMAKAGLAINRVFVMDASRRSGHGNAYFSGIGRVKRIVLYDTLLKKNTREEILAILAHEAGHWKKKHIYKRLIVTEILSLPIFYLVWWVVQNDYLVRIFNISQPTLFVKLLLVSFCLMLAVFPFKPVFAWFSRKHEWEADRFGVDLSGSPQALARALVKLGRDNLANLHPHPWRIVLYYSHPPLSHRVKALLRAAGEQGRTKAGYSEKGIEEPAPGAPE
ncbi:MAG: M48 family metallopeptidase [Desulfurivibrionaceae bacterium]